MNRSIKIIVCLSLMAGVVAHSGAEPSVTFEASNDTKDIRLVPPLDSCRPTKFLAQIDGGEGYWENPSGTTGTVGIFFPSAIFRAAVVCDRIEDGWEVGFIQGLTKFERDLAFTQGTLLLRMQPMPMADTIRVSTGVFRSVVARKIVSAGVPTEAEHQDQPRFTVPWILNRGASSESDYFKSAVGRFAATVYFVMIHERSQTMAILRQASWQSAVNAQCDSNLRKCSLTTMPRAAFSPETVQFASFPRQILSEPVASKSSMTEVWLPTPPLPMGARQQ